MTTLAAKRASVFLGLLAGTLGLALIQNRLLWGFWVSRPTLVHELEEADKLIGLTYFEVAPGGQIRRLAPRQELIQDSKAMCEPCTNECLEGTLLLPLERRWNLDQELPEVSEAVLVQGWQVAVSEDGISPIPLGLGIHFLKSGQEYLLFASRTAEVANDRHIYREILLSKSWSRFETARQRQFFYEVAGIEGLDWRVLWPLNLLLLAVIAAIGGSRLRWNS